MMLRTKTRSRPPYSMKQPQLQLADHLSGREIYERYRKTTQAVERTHWQVIYLRKQGKGTGEIAEVTAYSPY